MKRSAWFALLLAACARPNPGAPGAGAQSTHATALDSLRGRVEVVGSEPGTSIALLLDGGARAVALEGERPLLDRLSGLEVAVWGTQPRPGVMRVTRVTVRAAGGEPAVDGILTRAGAGWVLATAEGARLPLPSLPQALRGKEGARVWMTGPPARPPQSFGVIQEP
jgi:hypothetical protein